MCLGPWVVLLAGGLRCGVAFSCPGFCVLSRPSRSSALGRAMGTLRAIGSMIAFPFRVLAAIARGIVSVVKFAFETATFLLAVLVVLVVAAIAVAFGWGIADGLVGLHSVAPFMGRHHDLRVLAQIVGGLAGLFVAFLIVLAKKRSSPSAQSPSSRAPSRPAEYLVECPICRGRTFYLCHGCGGRFPAVQNCSCSNGWVRPCDRCNGRGTVRGSPPRR